MISFNSVKTFCCEDISLIENYDKAICDQKNTWSCHHKLEIHSDYTNTKDELISMGLYYNRPACELIFLPKSEHTRLHNQHMSDKIKEKISLELSGKPKSIEHRRKLSESRKGKHGHPLSDELKEKIRLSNLGQKRSQQTRQNISNAMKGKPGHKHTEEFKKKLSERMKGFVSPNKGTKLVMVNGKRTYVHIVDGGI